MKVVVFASGRADLGPLAPVVRALACRPDVEVTIATALTFTAASLEVALAALDITLPTVRVRQVGPLIDGDGVLDLVKCGARVSEGVGALLSDERGVLVVLGDRWELPWVIMPGLLLGIPVVHLHGGEVTEGAIDDRVRHAVTKLADVHCVASEDAARRLRQLGEPASAIHVTGAPGLDRFRDVIPAPDSELAVMFGHGVKRPLALFTYHPVTTRPVVEAAGCAAEALRAVAEVAGEVLVTHPGPDPGREAVLGALTTVATELDNVTLVPALADRYPSVLAAADVVVGNSSSGLIEAASAGIPAVDIGNRQRGRLRGANVIHTSDGFVNVKIAVQKSLDPGFASSWGSLVNPYGKGNSAEAIADVIVASAASPSGKHFIDADDDKWDGGHR